MRVLVTGATGFVGRFLCPMLAARGHQVTAAVRQLPDVPVEGADSTCSFGDIGPDTDWSEVVSEIDAIMHLAARTHVLNEKGAESDALYHQVNVGGTTGLARAAAARGIQRFVFLSSIKALGERSGANALTESTPPVPEDAYGQTKLEAEKALQEIAAGTGMEVAILRPPLVYGPGVKANLLRLIKACNKRTPLPLGLVDNKRSLVYIGNLADALVCLLESKGLTAETFLVCDGEAISTPELVRRISAALDQSPRLIPCPVWLLRLAGVLTAKSETIDRLAESLEIDDSKIRRQLGWTPPFNMLQGLERTAAWFTDQESR